MKNQFSNIRVVECAPSEKNDDRVALKLEQDVQTTYDGSNEHVTNSFGLTFGQYDNKRTTFFYLPTEAVASAKQGKVYKLDKVQAILEKMIAEEAGVKMSETDSEGNPLVRIRKARAFSPFYNNQKPVRGVEPPSEKSGLTFEEDEIDGETVYIYLKDGKPFYQITGLCFKGEADVDGTVSTPLVRFNKQIQGVPAGI